MMRFLAGLLLSLAAQEPASTPPTTSSDAPSPAAGLERFEARRQSQLSALLIAAPAQSDLLRERALAESAQRDVALLATALPPSTAASSDWLESSSREFAAALADLASRTSTPSVAVLAIGAGAAPYLDLASRSSNSLVGVQRVVLLDAPSTLADILFAGGQYRTAEHAAVLAASTGRDLATMPVLRDEDPSLWTPLVSPAAIEAPAPADSAALAPPTLHLSGWFRPHLASTVRNWRAAFAKNPETHTLRIGAWTDQVREKDVEPLAGTESVLDEALRWLDQDPSQTATPAVQYDVLLPRASGTERVRTERRSAQTWPPTCASCTVEPWFLHSGARLSRTTPGPNAPSSYRYDPTAPVFSIGGSSWQPTSLLAPGDLGEYPLEPLETGPQDQRRIGERSDYLRFRSRPLEGPLNIVGDVAAELWVATDAPETQFVVKLVQTFADGYQSLLREAVLVTRKRSGRRQVAPEMPFGIAQKVRIDLGPLAVRLAADQRLEVHVTSSSWPFVAAHDNRPPEDVGAAQPAHQTLFHDRNRQSALLLPIEPRQASTAEP